MTLARTAVERDYRGEVVDSHAPEMPTRFAKMLGQVLRGALSLGLEHGHALAIAHRVARDSVPPLRLLALLDVLDYPGARTREVTRRLQRPRSTVDRVLQELHVLGLLVVAEDVGQQGTGWQYHLSKTVDPEVLARFGSRTRNVTTPGYGIEEELSLPTDISGAVPTQHLGADSPDAGHAQTSGPCVRCGALCQALRRRWQSALLHLPAFGGCHVTLGRPHSSSKRRSNRHA